jgi:hypothetical protein
MDIESFITLSPCLKFMPRGLCYKTSKLNFLSLGSLPSLVLILQVRLEPTQVKQHLFGAPHFILTYVRKFMAITVDDKSLHL